MTILLLKIELAQTIDPSPISRCSDIITEGSIKCLLSRNVRYNSAIYDLPQAPPGKRGRPVKRGRRLSLIEDFSSAQLHQNLSVWHVHGRKKLHLIKLAVNIWLLWIKR